MNRISIPRIVLTGTSSGSGKTTITCGLLQLAKNKGIKVSSFKCGPDYIDPMFHKKIIETPSNNLDSFFMDENSIKNVFVNNAGELNIIEGVMGYYDGTGNTGLESSTYELSKTINSNVILIVNCKGVSTSIIPIIKGFKEYKEDSNIKGVILNNITNKTYQKIKELINNELPDIKVVGYVPKLPSDCILESRHLGLVTAEEVLDLKKKINYVADILNTTIDFDLLVRLAEESKELEYEKIEYEKLCDVRIGVALDKAFCFYYDANLKLLESLGAELIYFSPLNDKIVPSNLDGLYIGGGYPELYKDELENNVAMKDSLNKLLDNDIPFIAECGGFMYLNDYIEDKKMLGYFTGKSVNTNKLVRFGYLKLVSESDNMLLNNGESIKAHEFHYYDMDYNGLDLLAIKLSGVEYHCGYCDDHSYAGYPHIHFYSNMKAAERFILKCKNWRENNVKG